MDVEDGAVASLLEADEGFREAVPRDALDEVLEDLPAVGLEVEDGGAFLARVLVHEAAAVLGALDAHALVGDEALGREQEEQGVADHLGIGGHGPETVRRAGVHDGGLEGLLAPLPRGDDQRVLAPPLHDQRLDLRVAEPELGVGAEALIRPDPSAISARELGDLALGALVMTHLGGGLAVHAARVLLVDVLAGGEGLELPPLARHEGGDAALDLRVVGDHEAAAGRGDEGGADQLAERGHGLAV